MVIKKSIGVLVSLIAMCVIGCFTVYAEDDATVESTVTEQALSWCETVYSDVDFEVKDIIPIVDNEGNVYAFSASVWSGDIPYGYVNVDLTLDFPVYDAAVEQNTNDVFTRIVQLADNKYGELATDEFYHYIFSPNSICYYIMTKNDKKTFDDYGNMVDITFDTSLLEYGVVGHYNYNNTDEFMETTINKSKYDLKTPHKLSKRYYFSQDRIIEETSRYACGVVALTEVMYQNGIQRKIINNNVSRDSLRNTFNNLWNYSATTVIKTNNDGISFGSTDENMLKNAFEIYCKTINKTGVVTTSSNPSAQFFKNAVDNDRSSILCFSYNNNNEKKSHAVSVVAYRDVINKKTKKTGTYILVADGWHDTVRYINYNEADIFNRFGLVFQVK